jgi:putative peptidoglycan lipid II flippase
MTPLVMSIVNIVLNLVVEIPLLWWLGESAMAVGTLVSFIIQAVMMLIMLDRRIGGLGLGAMIKPTLKMLAASIVMGGVLWSIKISPLYPRGQGRMIWSAQLALMLIVGAAIYFAASYAMGLDTFRQLVPKRARKIRDAA